MILQKSCRQRLALLSLNKLNRKDYFKRLQGALRGCVAGIALGKPVEMGLDQEFIKKYLKRLGEYPLNDFISPYSKELDFRLRGDCIPSCRGSISYLQPDDDMHYTILALLLAEYRGFDFTQAQVGENRIDNVPYHWFWCASRQAYYHMVNQNSYEPIDDQVARF